MTWLEEASEGHAVKLAIYDGKSWSKPSTIISSNKLFVNWADFPSLVVLKNGTLAAQWLQKSGDGEYAYDVMISTSSDNGK
ncbi:glycoside hydrolase, partial [bacterium]|nr:glycoside hydrolase [bacterium]